jgi:hypothetical protein
MKYAASVIYSAFLKTLIVTILLSHFGSNLKAQTKDIELLENINLKTQKVQVHHSHLDIPLQPFPWLHHLVLLTQNGM